MSSVTTSPASTVVEPSESARPRAMTTWSTLAKARLSALVVFTTAAGYLVAPSADRGWEQFLGTVGGTALAAASAAILNQFAEIRRDARMERTRNRPLPAGHVAPALALVVGLLAAYAGVSMVAFFGNLLASAMTLGTIAVYVLLYTPLKPRTTLNTLVGAVTGATPPMIGWAAATGALEPGAWVLGGILFVWQIPHFFALAWLYREDYRRGGFAMLPVLDEQGRITAETVLLTSLLLVPLSLLATMFGVAGWWYAAGSVVLGCWLCLQAWRFWRRRDDSTARAVFVGSIVYLPLLLVLLVIDRGAVTPLAAVRGGFTVETSGSAPLADSPSSLDPRAVERATRPRLDSSPR